MAAKGKDAPVVADFDSPEYDAQFEDGTRLNDRLESAITASPVELLSENARISAMQQAVEATISSALTTIDMLFMARDDTAVTPGSLVNGSWDPEQEPEPCSVDNWLRAAIPETTQPKTSYMLAEFLRGSAAGPSFRAASMRRSESKRSNIASSSGAPPNKPARTSPSPLAAQSPSPSRNSPSPTRRKHLTPEQAAVEARLREELEIRRAQLAVLADLDAKDAAARARLSTISKELRGKDYSYDHKGQVVPLAPVDEGGPHHAQLSQGPTFTVRLPEEPTAGKQLRRGMSMAKKEPPKGPAALTNTKGSAGERKLTNDFRETTPKTQPSTLQIMAPSGGVTLRGGGSSKTGPARAKQGLGMSRDELDRYAATVNASALRNPATTAATAQSPVPDLGRSGSPRATLPSPSKGAPPRLEPLPTRTVNGAPEQPATIPAHNPHAPLTAEPSTAPSNHSSHHNHHQQQGNQTLDGTLGPGSLRFSEGLLAQLPNSPSRLTGAKARELSTPSAKPTTPDANPALVTAPDWGRSAGVSAGKHPALDTVKPTERDREMEVGRNMRLPRDRVTQATSSPPISPSKLQPHVPQPTFVHG